MIQKQSLAERALAAGRVLKLYIESKTARLRYGAKERQVLLATSQSGKSVAGHYRVQWVGETANKVLATLRDAAHEFNGRHPWNAISAADFTDVLHTVLHQVTKTEESDEDES